MTQPLLNHRVQIRHRVVAVEARCARQADRIAFKRARGQDTTAAEILLVKLEMSLTLMREHERQVIALCDRGQRIDAVTLSAIKSKAGDLP